MTDNNAEPNASKKDYKKLVNRLRCPKRVGANREACTGCEFLIEYGVSGVCICDPAKIDKQAADAIEELQSRVSKLEERTKAQQERIDDYMEKQLIIDRWGAKWMTSAKDVPTAAYEHGYSDGFAEAKQKLPKRGEWIWNPDGIDFGIGAWVCGNCRTKPNTFWEGMHDIKPLRFSGSRYCPNCGADMSAKMGVQDADN